MPLPDPDADLIFARTIRDKLREGYQTMVETGPRIQRYKIGDREMEYREASSMLADLRHWEGRVKTLEAAQGIRPKNRISLHL